jgi:hypothetical protein
MHYDPDSNILSWEISRGTIVDTKVIGKVILHIGKTGQPLLIEILDASKVVGKFEKLSPKEALQSLNIGAVPQ